MKTRFSLLLLLIGIQTSGFGQALLPSFGSARSGTSGFQFTKITVDARSASLGNSSVADAFDASSLYWNPALSVQIGSNQLMASYTSYFADINQGYLAYVQQFKRYNIALGFSLQYLDSGEMNETTEFMPQGTGRTFRTVHYAVGLTVAQKLTDLFSYGITARFLDERIENITMQTGTVDLGFFYKVGETGLRFAVGVNNFGFDASPSGETTRLALDTTIVHTEFETVSPPTNFMIGAAYDAWQNETMKLIITTQLTKPSDNAERLALGAELGFLNKVFFRTGYEFGIEEVSWPSFGLGLNTEWQGTALTADLSYTFYERLGNLPRFALKFGF